MRPESHWAWPLTWQVPLGDPLPFDKMLWWHYHCLLTVKGDA